MNSLGSLAGGFGSRAGAPAWFTCLNAPMHESQGRFPAEELERKAAAPTSDSLHSASQNSGWEKLFVKAVQRKGGHLNLEDATAETAADSVPFIFFLHYLVKIHPCSWENIKWCLHTVRNWKRRKSSGPPNHLSCRRLKKIHSHVRRETFLTSPGSRLARNSGCEEPWPWSRCVSLQAAGSARARAVLQHGLRGKRSRKHRVLQQRWDYLEFPPHYTKCHFPSPSLPKSAYNM